MEILIELSGWVGTILIVWAYYLVSCQKLEPTGRVYQIFNLIGSIGIGVNVFFKQAWPALALEIIWGLIAIFTLLKFKRTSEKA